MDRKIVIGRQDGGTVLLHFYTTDSVFRTGR